MIGILRMLASIVMGILAFLALLVAFILPITLPEQVATSQEYERSFRDAETYVRNFLDNGGKLPVDLDDWSRKQRPRLIALEAAKSGANCGANFKVPATDRFVLSFWRGEWFECYSSPSGHSTLLLSTSALLLSGLWINLAVYLAVGFGAGWLAWRIWPRPKPV